MSGFSKILKGTIEYESVKNAVEGGRVPMGIIGLSQIHKAHYISSLCVDTHNPALIVCHDEGTASRLCDDLNALCGGAWRSTADGSLYFPAL